MWEAWEKDMSRKVIVEGLTDSYQDYTNLP